MAENYALLAHLAQLMESTNENLEFLEIQICNPTIPTETREMLVQTHQTLVVQMNTLVFLNKELGKSQDALEFIASKFTLN